MHLEQLKFVELTRDYFANQKDINVLEVGSYDVNGSIRVLFKNTNYTGVDLSPGPGVDVVCSGHTLDLPDETFDITISCECFEHNPFWVETFLNMHRMTKKNGLVVVSCASKGRPEHGTTRTSDESPGTKAAGINYYRNLNEKDFRKEIDLGSLFKVHKFYYAPRPKDLYFIGWMTNENVDESAIRLFENEVRKINDIQPREGITLKTPFLFLYRIPIKIAVHFLNDPLYQNFSIWYSNFLLTPRTIINKFFGRETITHGVRDKSK